MESISGIGAVAGMFLLRLMVPLLITVALSWALHRLDAKWHPEAKGESDKGRQIKERGRIQHNNTHEWAWWRKAP